MKESIRISILASLFMFLFLFSAPDRVSGQQKDKSYYENQVISAVEKYDSNDFEGASDILEEVIAGDPENDAAHYYMGLSAFCRKDFVSAERELKTAVQLDSMNFWYRYRLALVYSATDRKELTIAMYEKLLKDFPKKSDLYYNLIDMYLSDGQSEKALETLSQIEAVAGKNDATAMTRFQLLASQGKQKEAYESLEEYNREYSSPQVLSVLGDYQMSMYNDSTAIRLYDEALDIAPGYAPAVLGKAEALRVTRQYDRYFSIINRFLSDDTVPAVGKCDYLKAVMQQSDPMFLKTFMSRVDTMVTNAVSAHPKDSVMLLTAGIYYFGTDRESKALEYLKYNMDIYPESLSAAANYVEVLMYGGNWDALAEESENAFRKFPEETAFLEMSSMAYYNKGEYDKVLDNCRTILNVAAGDSLKTLTAYSTMGDMYHQLGENAKAYKAYDSALKINATYAPVLNNYAFYLSMEGRKLKKAAAMSKITVDQEPDNPTYLDTYAWILYLQGKPEEAKPLFKHAMLYGGKDSVVILDHYAEVLYALKEYDLAMVYWTQASMKNNNEIPGLDQRIKKRKAAINKK